LEGIVEFETVVVFVRFEGLVVLSRVVFEGLVELIGLEGLVVFE
jgi:hypothetical protein